MSYSVPYSFIPGTKARAQEVNANFNALTGYCDAFESGKANTDLSNLTSGGLEVIKNNSISKNIGEFIISAVPISDSGLHLLDGALINGSGIYADFVTYIAGLVSDYPDLFETEANWQQSVTDYGVCGKFVYTAASGNDPATVRLPKITGVIEGTTDVTALGNLVEAGLPNITGTAKFYSGYSISSSGALTYTKDTSSNNPGGGNMLGNATLSIDASNSSPIYGNSTTVQPQTIKLLYYIVVATTSKTEIQVDIDEIATDLNGKADTNLSNVPTSKGILSESYVNGTSWYRIYADGWCEQGGRKSASTDGDYSVTFLQSYTDTNYTLAQWSGLKSTYGSQYNNGVSVKSLSTTGFTYNSYDYNNTLFWQASGYIR